MSVPPYFRKAAAAVAGAVGDVTAEALEERLAGVTVEIQADDSDPTSHLIATTIGSLLGRLYSSVRVEVGGELGQMVRSEVLAVNPDCDLEGSSQVCTTVNVGGRRESADVAVNAEGWNVLVDCPRTGRSAASASAALSAAALGANEVFRSVFAAELGRHGRTTSQPTTVSLVTFADAVELVGDHVDLGQLDLAGAGAIGQAALLTLRESNVSADIRVIDPERLDETNLQRYILSHVGDEGILKVDLATERAARPGLRITRDCVPWSSGHGSESHRVLCGLDTADARRGVQASLPRSVYNAYTGLDDIGWSRHENFEQDPCLACLYWPAGAGRTYAEEVGAALRVEPKRIAAYQITRTPVDEPLDAGQLSSGFSPDQLQHWSKTSLLDDLACGSGRSRSSLNEFSGLSVDELYRQGICGGALLDVSGGRAAVVPLAHESLMAGVLLVTQVIVAATPQLAIFRSDKVEGRWNLRAGPSAYHLRQPEKREKCICADRDFTDAHLARWG